MNKKGAVPFVAFLMLLGFVVSLIAISNQYDLGLAEIFGYDLVYKANWGHICCEKVGAYDYTYYKWLDQQTTFSCTGIYTDECNILVEEESIKFGHISGYYTITGLTQQPYVGNQEFTILAGKSVTFSAGLFTADNTKVTLRAKTFRLVGEENGKIFTSQSCVLSSELRRQVTSDGRNEIPFDQCDNYLTDFIQVATKTYSYSGNEVICQARTLYDVDNQQFKDGQTRKIQGEQVATVECCPTENNCGDNFKFQEDEKNTCTYSTECPNGGDLYGVTQTGARKYSCVSGQCVAQDVSVECTSTAVCTTRYGDGYVCDLSPNNWGKCIGGTSAPYCGDGFCEIGESKSNCPADCELECMEGEKLITRTSYDGGLLCFKYSPIKFGCNEVVEKYCSTDTAEWIKSLVWILFGILIVVLIFKFGRPIWNITLGRIIKF